MCSMASSGTSTSNSVRELCDVASMGVQTWYLVNDDLRRWVANFGNADLESTFNSIFVIQLVIRMNARKLLFEDFDLQADTEHHPHKA